MERAKLAKTFSKNLTGTIRKAVVQNKSLILREVQKKRDLYHLLIKWNQGEALSECEKETIWNQLIDIAKAIPALTIFVLPFGGLVLLIMIKYLPTFLLPNMLYELTENELKESLTATQEKSFPNQNVASA